MHSVSGDVIYGGPSIHGLVRECACEATAVIPTTQRGYVRWDAKRYAAGGAKEPEVEWTDEQLDPIIPAVPPTTIDDVYKRHIKEIT